VSVCAGHLHMTDMNPGSGDPSSQPPESFRWQLYFQKSTEPLFFLNRRRRLLFVNRAWESLTGLPLGEVRGQACRRRALGPDAPAMPRVCAQVRLASQVHVPASLLGEPGTGKRWLARCIHRLSARREGTFAVVDCLHLPQQALAEALFGESGLARRLQLGTLYLHEPGHLPREMQDRLSSVAGAWSDGERAGPALLAGFSSDPQEEVGRGRLLP